jgi:polysaccharide pyruvyl transferase WcaK-like protein
MKTVPQLSRARAIPAALRRGARNGVRAIRDFDPLVLLPWPPPDGERPHIGLVGYYGWGNYGDELFLEVLHRYLLPDLTVETILGPDKRAPRVINRAVRMTDAVFIGGGDLVITWSSSSQYFERVYLRRPVFVGGVGVPIAGLTETRALHAPTVTSLRRFFGHPNVRFVAARDEESAAWMRHHLDPLVGVVTAPDMVCALPLPPVERIADPPLLGVIVRRRRVETDLENIRRLCQRAERLGYRIRQIVLATGSVRDRDVGVARELALPDAEFVVSDDLADLTRAIGECTVLASMKFHGTVVATMFGIPSIVLSPSAKTRNFLRRIDRPDLLSGFSDPDLPDHLNRDMEPIDEKTIRDLRDGAIAMLSTLKREMIGAVRPLPT